MEKIKLTKRAKEILKQREKNNYKYKIEDRKDILLLAEEGLLKATKTTTEIIIKLTDKGEAYLHINPKLNNPSIWDDKKYLITTAIAIIALIMSFISIITKQ